VIGRAQGVPAAVKRGIDHVTDATAGNTGMTLFMAFNYGAATSSSTRSGRSRGGSTRGARPAEIDEDRISRALYTGDAPDPTS